MRKITYKIHLTEIGKKIKQEINNLEKIFPIKIEKYVIMPNHIHLIINFCILKWNGNEMHDISWADTRSAPTLPRIIQVLKSKTSLEYIKNNKKNGEYRKLWQRNYYEHIIRTEKEYYQICKYIKNNPARYLIKNLK